MYQQLFGFLSKSLVYRRFACKPIQRITQRILLLCAAFFLPISSATAVDNEIPELVITGKQSKYMPMDLKILPRKPLNLREKLMNADSRLVTALPTYQPRHSERYVNVTSTFAGHNGLASLNPANVSTANVSSVDFSKPILTAKQYDAEISPLRLRKHRMLASSARFLQLCAVNDCLLRDPKQNFIVR